MSDHWEFFPCQMGEHRAFVFYDHGISAEIAKLRATSLLRIKVSLQSPNEVGLPCGDEFASLNAVEEALSAFMAQRRGAFVGRVTVNGARHFLGYVEAADTEVEPFLAELEASSGYKPLYSLEPDPDRKGYWDELYPSLHDWQVIQDLKVIQQLQNAGDPLLVARRVDHWAYFPKLSGARRFQDWVNDNGFEFKGLVEPSKHNSGYGVHFFHVATPTLEEISHHTILLTDKAKELGGDYDGWETSVEKPGV